MALGGCQNQNMEKNKVHSQTPTRRTYERILWLHQKIQAGEYPNAQDLRAHFEISIRTAHRDVAFLRDHLCAPLRFDRQRQGFYYTDPAFQLPVIWMTGGELLAIFLAERVLRQYAGTPYEAGLRSAFEKICRALPEPVSVDLNALGEVVSFEVGPARPVEAEIYRQVAEAIQERRRLQMDYYVASRNERTQRRIDPYHLHNHAGDWYLIAYDHRRCAMRDFALSRIQAIKETGETFELRPDFDRRVYLANHFGGYRSSKPVEVVVRFDAYQSRWIREKQWQGETKRTEHPDGSLTLHLTVPVLDAVMRWILQFGSHAQVLEPQELRESMEKEVEAMRKGYAGRGEGRNDGT